MSLYVGVGQYRVIPGCPVKAMTDNDAIRVKPPVEKGDIESSFDVEWNDNQLTIEAGHEWSVDADPTVWSDYVVSEGNDSDDVSQRETSNLTYDEIEDIAFTEWDIEIQREFQYKEKDEYDEYVACYISKYCDVPDINGFADHSEYSFDFPDPWLFNDSQEEFRVDNGIPVERCLNSYFDEDNELVTEEWYEPIYEDSLGQLDITTFAYAHHFGKLTGSPDPVDQVNDVLQWKYPEAVTLDEYKQLTSSVTTEARAD